MLTHNVLESADQAISYFSAGEYYEVSLPGQWYGKAAKEMGLTGKAEKRAFDMLCRNRNPFTGKRVTGKDAPNRRVGYDFTFSMPKSAAILCTILGDRRILTVFEEAVLKTLEKMESLMEVRVRRKGQPDFDRITGNMVAALYTHFLARPVDGWADPHIHLHAVMLNMSQDDIDLKWKAGQFGRMLEQAPYFQEVFDSHFAKGLAGIGYSMERREKKLEIKGVSEEVVQKFSRRSKEIEKKAKELKITDPKEKAQLSLSTRDNKRDGLTGTKLKERWRAELTDEEYQVLKATVATAEKGPVAPDHKSAREMIDYASRHLFERASVISEHMLLIAALKTGTGVVSLEDLKQALNESDIIHEKMDGETWLTTPAVLREEFENITFVKDGRGALDPIDLMPEKNDHEQLSDEQWQAVRHVLTSADQVTAIAGAPGTGKTTLMKAAIARMEASGLRVFTCAPSADAARGVLREEGFGDADTLHKLLQDRELQENLTGQVVWVDEAGLVGANQMHQLFSLAAEKGFRIILAGDTGQHSPVPRGDALRLLENHAGLVPARVRTIRRQKSSGYRNAVKQISEGNVGNGFADLDELGFILEIPTHDRHTELAKAYLAAVEAQQSCLVVAPTHTEGDKVTELIRSELRKASRLGRNGMMFRRLKNLNLTEAERTRPQSYAIGMTVQFNQPLPGQKILRGDRVAVTSVSKKSVEVLVNGMATLLPLEQASKFTVYAEGRLHLAAGDRIRITRNGYAKDGQRLSNGALHTVKDFTKKGEIILSNNMVLPSDFGHLSHGYCLTSMASQGKTVDHVLIAQSAESLGAASSLEQFNVSVSRGREAVSIFTDDKKRLLKAVSKSSGRKSAHDLIAPNRRKNLLRQIDRHRLNHRIDALKQFPQVSNPEPEPTTPEIEI